MLVLSQDKSLSFLFFIVLLLCILLLLADEELGIMIGLPKRFQPKRSGRALGCGLVLRTYILTQVSISMDNKSVGHLIFNYLFSGTEMWHVAIKAIPVFINTNVIEQNSLYSMTPLIWFRFFFWQRCTSIYTVLRYEWNFSVCSIVYQKVVSLLSVNGLGEHIT